MTAREFKMLHKSLNLLIPLYQNMHVFGDGHVRVQITLIPNGEAHQGSTSNAICGN
jgi:hypothetical protein